ncbi:MAG: NAD(+) synthase [Prevotellaceae bacterium]|jgi:NAD+ synthase (glutamine-hydrolysing)|nr:NAD(+) synthase [Prevotellaceae bacterium]
MDNIQHIYNKLIAGLRKYFNGNKATKATLGLSGGLDSAVVLSLATEALGKDNVWVLLLPSQYSTSHSVNDAVRLAENLGIQYDLIKIEPIYNMFIESLSSIFAGTRPNVTEENLQARIRSVLLMALSNKFGHFLLNTSNKSELAMGYGTLYGDLSGALSVLGDVYKTQVYDLAYYINRHGEIIPEHIITKAPSAELSPGQKDTDSLPPYPELDPILMRFIEEKLTVEEIIAAGFDRQLVERINGMIARNSFKVFQIPPIIKITGNLLTPEWKCI